MKKLPKYEKLALYLIILGTILRFFLVFFVEVTAEPAWHMNVARYIATNLKIPLLEHLGRDVFWPSPFFHILMATFYKTFSVFGENAAIFGAQLVTPLLASFTLIFNYLIAKHLFNEKIGFYSTLFLAFLPAHFYFSVLAYTDIALMLFVLVSVYFALKRKYLLSGLFSGIAILTKYTGIITLMVIVPMIFLKEQKKDYVRSYTEYLGLSIPIGSIWFIRNWILLGNPVWRFMHNLAPGHISHSASGVYSFSKILSFKPISTLYAGLLGVPASRWSNLFYFDIPFIWALLVIWLIGTALFLFPSVLGFKHLKKRKRVLAIWLFPFILLALFLLYNLGNIYLRYLFPILPILGISWAFGFIKIKKIHPKLMISIFVLIVLGITTVEFAKAAMASKSIQKYEVDFNWIKQNTDKDAVFLIEGDQAPSFYFNRYTYNFREIKNLSNIDYVWVNPTLPSHADYTEEFLEEVEEAYQLVYINNATKTKIYKVTNR